MANTRRWTEGTYDRGFQEIKLSHWKWFSTFIDQELKAFSTYIFRGHADAGWLLQPTLDRQLRSGSRARRDQHLENFKFAARGRRGANPPTLTDDDDWWALGQHHGLATPLLDWTSSPFVAFYFAMRSANVRMRRACVWAIAQEAIDKINSSISPADGGPMSSNQLKIIRPMSDENDRLVAQGGLFTRGPNNTSLEDWMRDNNRCDAGEVSLIKISFPIANQRDCLTYLNRMNISHLTLFPDLNGASLHTNLSLRIKDY